MVGTTISYYNIPEETGQDGFGEVYRDENTNLSREVAIKVGHPLRKTWLTIRQPMQGVNSNV